MFINLLLSINWRQISFWDAKWRLVHTLLCKVQNFIQDIFSHTKGSKSNHNQRMLELKSYIWQLSGEHEKRAHKHPAIKRKARAQLPPKCHSSNEMLGFQASRPWIKTQLVDPNMLFPLLWHCVFSSNCYEIKLKSLRFSALDRRVCQKAPYQSRWPNWACILIVENYSNILKSSRRISAVFVAV